MQRLRTIAWNAQAAWKRLASVFKKEWTLDDYPVRVRFQKPDAAAKPSRLKLVPWSAQVFNWPQMSGHGDTKQEALADIRKKFEDFVATKEPLPRPGVAVPLKYAESRRVSQHAELAKDFTQRVLELDWAWISDESSLWDFHTDETNEKLVSKIREVYGIDVSALERAKLADIFDKIREHRGG